MIIEGILTTINVEGSVNIAPMGALIDDETERSFDHLRLRPYRRTTSLANLKRTGQGVFHITDDVHLLARAAVGHIEPPPELRKAEAIEGFVLADACRWYSLRVEKVIDSEPRAAVEADIVESGRIRDFLGLNRAKHAIVEAAILATRLELLPIDHILLEYARLMPLVEKTGGPNERAAMEFLQEYVEVAARQTS